MCRAVPVDDSSRAKTFAEQLKELRDGHPSPEWNAIFPKVIEKVTLAIQRRLPGVDVYDEAVSSACRTLIRRLQTGQFNLDDPDDITRLLIPIAYCKAVRKLRHFRREKTGLDSAVFDGIVDESTVRESSVSRQLDILTMMNAYVRSMLGEMNHLLKYAQHRQIFRLIFEQKYAGRAITQDDIARKIGCSVRTVRRVWVMVRKDWQILIDEGRLLLDDN